ncbi:MAG: hypothetical protein FJ280_00120 [Planctomycetes bacterium]|nr:hypothetical protein [Planctomycetota bacterium]
MPYVSLQEYFPEVAKQETRSITVFPGSGSRLPPNDYGFLEMYCDEPGCDCRRVLFYVIARSRPGVQAVIGWGWEDVDFYARWMGSGDQTEAARLKGPALNLLSPATDLAPALVDLVRNVLLQDSKYVERIKRHYQMFRENVERNRRRQRRRPRKRR